MKTFLGKKLWEFGKGTIVNVTTAVMMLGVTVYIGIAAGNSMRGNLLAIASTYGLIAAVFLVGHTIRTASQIYSEDQAEIGRLREQISMFTVLQLDAFRLAADLRDFLATLGSRPQAFTEYTGSNHLVAQCEAVTPWLNSLQNGYAQRFAPRIKDMRFRLGEAGVPMPYRICEQWFSWVVSEAEIEQCSKVLDQMAVELSWIPQGKL